MDSPQTSGLAIQSISKSYGEKNILHKLNININSGDFVSICGKSGVGKSTLLKIASGLLHPTSGEVYWNGEKLDQPPLGMGLVTQNYSASLLPWFSVKKNVALPLIGTIKDKSEIDQKVMDILDRVGLSESVDRYPSQLSGGMQQRVALARALVTNPRLLFLDEPFASVDALVRFELEDLLIQLVRKTHTTTLLVTHDIDEAIYLSDRVIVLAGSPAELLADIEIELGQERDQIDTRSREDFLRYRKQIYELLAAAKKAN